MDEETGKVEYVKKIIPDEDRGIRRFNDGMVDVKGRFWLAEIDRKALTYGAYNLPKDHGKPIGRLWRYDPDGSVHQMEDGLVSISRRAVLKCNPNANLNPLHKVCGNGLATSPDNKTCELVAKASAWWRKC